MRYNLTSMPRMDIISSARSKSIKLHSDHSDAPFVRTRTDTADYGSLVWKFDPDNHHLNLELVRLVYNKNVMRLAAFIMFVGFLMTILKISTGILLWYVVICESSFGLPVKILIILSFNRDARKFIFKSSEFWIKVIYAFIKPALFLIEYHQVGQDHYLRQDGVPPHLGYLFAFIQMISTPMMMIIAGGVDAIPQMSHRWKAILGGLLALQWSLASIRYQLLMPASDDYVVHVELTGSDISFFSLQSSVCGMLAVFLWKQLIDILRNPNRCICIAYKPYLQWERVQNPPELLRSASLPSVL